MKKENIFLTGATGFLGSYLLKILLVNGHKVYALARSKKNTSGENRVLNLLKFWDLDIKDEVVRKNLEIVNGDIASPNLGVSEEILKRLENEIEIIFHSAAMAELRVALTAIREVNVEGTENVLKLAFRCKNLKKVNHISTAYIVGTRSGIEFSEDMLDVGQGFNNTYEQSKFEAELLIKDYIRKGLNISVFRPSMVMGHSKDGRTNNFRLFYEPLHFFSLDIYDEFPIDLDCSQNFINIDTVAEAIYALGDINGGAVYHIVSPEDFSAKTFMKLASEYFGFKMPKCISVEKFDFEKWTYVQRALADSFVPYFNYRTKFSSRKTQGVLRDYNFKYPKMNSNNLKKIFEYAIKTNFIKRKDKYVRYFKSN